ncbi:hypothetical protein CMUS01_08931 [Colletotrichum musicola]|uniref:Uncharacterized protein n=1 Tax=Colletotrichum musicola TaxID=2175873 RepID=A0A8H6NCI6_9PEZI|nr:hypothetical protein CMUS01_08931 [Colletotrichum musicola]
MGMAIGRFLTEIATANAAVNLPKIEEFDPAQRTAEVEAIVAAYKERKAKRKKERNAAKKIAAEKKEAKKNTAEKK